MEGAEFDSAGIGLGRGTALPSPVATVPQAPVAIPVDLAGGGGGTPGLSGASASGGSLAVAASAGVRSIATGHHLWHGPGLVRRALHGGRRAPLATVVGFAILAAVIGQLVASRLTEAPEYRLLDFDVYRSAGQSLLSGRSLYGYLTPVPQLLPFTYPPFAAIVAMPLALLPKMASEYLWTFGTLAVLGWLVLVSFRPFVRRFPTAYRPLVVGCLLASMAWTQPVRDCLRFGQVGVFLAALCVLDCVAPKTRWPRGMLIGFATAIKLVPGVFIPYLWFTGRRRAALVATGSFVGLGAASAVVAPHASWLYWTNVMFDSNRLGDNTVTVNQSLRAIFLRWLPGHVGTALWIMSAIVVAVAGYRRAAAASKIGDELRGVVIVGLLSVLLSPVAWIHHLAGFVPVMLGVVLADGRDRRRVALALAGTVYFTLQLPQWGQFVVGHYHDWHLPGRILQDAFALGALLAVWLLGRLGSRSTNRTSGTGVAVNVSR